MGRPPLNLTRVPVRLSPEALERIDALVGMYGRAAFVREAVERELERREKGDDSAV
jgi:predicted DNA-binding protein